MASVPTGYDVPLVLPSRRPCVRLGVLGTPVWRDLGQFGDGTFRRQWSQMFYTKKACF